MKTDLTIMPACWDTDQQQLIAVRTAVFIQEQQVPAELEMDGQDVNCLHVKAVNSSGLVVGTARLLPTNYIGRMCVLKDFRKLGAGGQMLSYFIDFACQHNFKSLMLNAQISALSFYQHYGFKVDSDVFIEADIEHVHMTLTLAN